MKKVEKIKAEIERLKKSLPWGSCASQISMECNCKNEAYNEVLSYINSLEEEPVSNDLEEAAHFYVDTTIEWFDSEGNPCCYPAFIAGAQWQKEQMMKNSTFINEAEWEDDIHKLFREKGKKVKFMIVEEE